MNVNAGLLRSEQICVTFHPCLGVLVTKYYGVSLLISQQVLEQLSDPKLYQLRFLDRAIVKGRHDPISVYEVLAVVPDPIRELKLITQPDFEAGIAAYRDRNQMAAAKVGFERVLSANPDDKTAALYLERVSQLLEQVCQKTERVFGLLPRSKKSQDGEHF